ncbi:MAG: hypothetical protein CVT60_06640, partial [Actinobacteria bacterium HGW-Actinobacteria-10]
MEKMSAIRRWLNAPMLLFVVLLVFYGSVMVQSATSGMDAGSALFRRHILGLAIGLVPLAIAWAIDYRDFRGWLGPLVLFDALLIIAPRIPGLGDTAKGATSWLQIAGIRLFQPSEPAKLVTIIVMAIVISQFKGRIESGRDVAKVLAYMAVPLGLILLQPDLGTGLVFVAITMGMLLVGGMAGSVVGIWVFAMLTKAGQIDLFVQLAYVLFLGLVG